MTYQVLHNPELLKLDLSSLAYATAGAAHLPPELREAFKRKAKNLPFFYEGSDLPCHQWNRAYLQLGRIRAVRMRTFHRLSVDPRR
jgi:hypothetical protein